MDDVSGFYDVRYSNLQHNCPFPVPDPPSENVEVVQDGTALTFHTTAGNISGTIDSQTGDFQASATIMEPPCTYGCLSTTTGTFHLGQNPMTFEGKGKLDVLNPLGRVFCTITYDVAGIRTSCTVYQFSGLPASQPTKPD